MTNPINSTIFTDNNYTTSLKDIAGFIRGYEVKVALFEDPDIQKQSNKLIEELKQIINMPANDTRRILQSFRSKWRRMIGCITNRETQQRTQRCDNNDPHPQSVRHHPQDLPLQERTVKPSSQPHASSPEQCVVVSLPEHPCRPRQLYYAQSHPVRTREDAIQLAKLHSSQVPQRERRINSIANHIFAINSYIRQHSMAAGTPSRAEASASAASTQSPQVPEAIQRLTKKTDLPVDPKRPYDPSQGFVQQELGLAGAIMQEAGANTREAYIQALAVYFNPQRAEAMLDAIINGDV